MRVSICIIMSRHTKKLALLSLAIGHLVQFCCPAKAFAIEDHQAGNKVDSSSHKSHENIQHQSSSEREDDRRPVWNVAHMVNSIKELDYRLAKGANAIEIDVTFSHEGYPLYTYHGPPCDCWRHCYQQEDFNTYLRYVRELYYHKAEGIGKNLSILFLDLKLDSLDQRAKGRAGSELAKSLLANIFSQNLEYNSGDELNSSSLAGTFMNTNGKNQTEDQLAVIVSINHVTDVELIYNFLHVVDQLNSSLVLKYIGFDVGMNDDIRAIESMWRKFKGVELNLWQGDGYTNCISPFYNLERLSKALVRRNELKGYPSKVYQWTIDLHDRIREALRLGVDAIMTNHPERLVNIIQEPEVARNFRFATRRDNPFRKVLDVQGSGNRRQDFGRSSTRQSSGGFLAGIIDVLSSWIAYIREIPYFSLPTTSRFAPDSLKRRKPTIDIPETSQIEKRANNLEDSGKIIYLNAKSSSDTNRTGHDNNSTISSTTTTSLPAETTTVNPDQSFTYDGPKWYTSLASNLLVAALKLLLPIESR